MSARTLTVEFEERKIDAIFSSVDQCHLPGAAVGIAIRGRPAYRKGFGLANMELPVVLSPATRMRIYSTTKHFTCFAYMLLCEEGKARIDDPIGKYLPELHPIAHAVTLRQLMGNVGGLRDAHDIRWQFSGIKQPVSSADLLSLYQSIDDRNFAPGTMWRYNNGGFLIVSAVIERITGQSLEEVLRTRIFEQVGMFDTLLRRFDADFVANSATMHASTPEVGFDRSYLSGASAGEGGIVSTVDDMLTWLAHMDAPTLGTASTWAEMKTPLTLVNGTSTGYGLGLMLDRYRGADILHHGGGGLGSNSQMLKVPGAGLDIAIMVNRDDVVAALLAYRILDACVSGLEPIKPAPVENPISGVFLSPTTSRIIRLSSKNGQQLVAVDGLGVEIPYAVGDDAVLRPAGVFGFFKYAISLVGDLGIPTRIRFSDFGTVDELIRLETVDNSDVADARIVGRFRSDSTGTEAILHQSADGVTLTSCGRFGAAELNLECLTEQVWRAKSKISFLGGILSFNHAYDAFRFTSDRTHDLLFQRTA